MIELSACSGCEDDFYNGHNPYGVKECWGRKTGTMGDFLLIHIDQPPPYLHVKPQQLPSCYKLKRHVKVSPIRVDSEGYWKS